MPAASGRNLLPLPPVLLDMGVQSDGERTGSPPCHAPCVPVGPVSGRAGCCPSGHSLLLTSSWSPVTKQSSPSPWTRHPPDPWVAARPHCGSGWAAGSAVVGTALREAMAFCRLEPSLPGQSEPLCHALCAHPGRCAPSALLL